MRNSWTWILFFQEKKLPGVKTEEIRCIENENGNQWRLGRSFNNQSIYVVLLLLTTVAQRLYAHNRETTE